MNKVEIKDKYLSLFNGYTHNIPVIYSSMEGQYDGQLFVDSVNHAQAAILFTPFAFHFVAGNPNLDNIIDMLDEIIFKQYLAETKQKEAIIFCPSEKWDIVLDEVFARHNGLKDSRKVFCLNRDQFKKVQAGQKALDGVENKLLYEKANGSKKKYPVSRIFKGTKCISFCSGFMLGKGHAEIDVHTEEAYRGMGYAKEASITLINGLLESRIEPNWCTWPYRIESQKLALSLGFELKEKVPVHIWVEEECGKIEF